MKTVQRLMTLALFFLSFTALCETHQALAQRF